VWGTVASLPELVRAGPGWEAHSWLWSGRGSNSTWTRSTTPSSCRTCNGARSPESTSRPWATLGDSAECRRALYELNKKCSADIPERGEFYTFEEYLADRIETPSYDPNGVALAASNDAWVGMATTSLHQAQGYAFSEMTGVLASHRGRGISLALKLLAIRFARSSRYRWLRTFHHPANASAIGMNRRLGFVDEDAQLWSSRS
jgi:GNAT superfamily N-acetyltransferase